MSAVAAKTIKGSFDIIGTDCITDIMDASELVDATDVLAFACVRPIDGAFQWCKFLEAYEQHGVIMVRYRNAEGRIGTASYRPYAELYVATK